MSTTIDQRVVEMRFDNKHFESNVQTSLLTLERLKKSLNLTGASKGLENISNAAKNNNVHLIGNAAEQVGLKFSAMYTIADQTLRNIVNSVEHTAKRITSALTIDPIKTGLQEYETQINAVQTILANTQHNGTTLDEVNNALDTLNTYADKTIYNFTEMTRNIGTFTAAGVDLQTSVESIQGIANLAAVSGSTSQQASTAMYQLSQALAAGRVSLMDWNSVVNAGMGGKVFQDALVRTSELLKTGAKDAIETYGSFRESLTQGEWLTTEVLTETLKQLSGAYTEAELVAQGFTESQAKEIAQLAETATNAATKVKTFTQLWDTLKEAAQSGWTQTWELIIGDFEEAKELWTKISDVIGGFINKMSESRNNWLGGVLKSPWKKFNDELSEAGISVDKVQNKMRELYDNKHTEGAFDKLITKHGSFEKALRSGAISADMLKEAVSGAAGAIVDLSGVEAGLKMGDTGEDVKKVQEALQSLGYEFEKYGVDGIIGEETEGIIKAFQEANGLEITGVVDEETLAALEKMNTVSGKLSSNIDKVIDSLTGGDLGGREKIFKSFANIWKGMVDAIRPVTMAFRKVFPPIAQESGMKLIDTFLALTEKIQITDETAAKIYNTFKGLFSIIDIVTTVLGGGLSVAFKIATKILGAFGIGILDVTSFIGKAISGFHDWIFETGFIAKAFDSLIEKIPAVVDYFKDLFKAFKGTEQVQNLIETFNRIVESVKQLFKLEPGSLDFKSIVESIKTDLASLPGQLVEIGRNIIAGLRNGLGEGVGEIFSKISEIATTIITTICDILGIQSPSTVMFEIGRFIIEGLVNGISAGISLVVNGIRDLGIKIANIFKKIDWSGITEGISTAFAKFKELLGKFDYGKLVALIPIGAVLLIIKKIYDLTSALGDSINSFNDVIDGFADIEKNFSKVLGSFSKKLQSEALKNLAISVAILVGSVVALTLIDPSRMYDAVAVIVILSGVLVALSFAMDKLSTASMSFDGKTKSFNAEGIKTGLLSIGIALLLLAATVKIVGSMDPEEAVQGFLGLAALVVAMTIFLAACGKIGKVGETKDMDKIGKMLTKMAFAMLLMVAVVKLASGLSAGEMLEGVAFAAGFALFVRAIVSVSKDSGENISKVGGLMIKLSIALGLMVGVVKLISLLSPSEMIKGAVFVAAFGVFVAAMVKVTKIGKEDKIAKLGGLLLSISLALSFMVVAIKLISFLDVGEIIKGAAFVAGFVIFVKALVEITKIGNEQKMAKVAGTILAASIAVGILAGIAILLGMVQLEGLAKGVIAVSLLGLVMAAMIKATQGANKVVGNLVVMSIAIAVMAGAVAALTLIDGTKLVTAAASLSLVMGAFAIIAKFAGPMSKNALLGLGAMTLVVGGLALIFGLMAKFEVQASITTAISLGILLSAMAVALNILSKCGTVSGGSLLAMALIGLVVAEMGIVLKILQDMNVQPSIETATALSILLLGMSAACLILSAVGPVALQAVVGAAGLAGVILVLGGLIAVLGELGPGLQDALNNGIPALEAIGIGLGKFVGGLVGGVFSGIADGVIDSLPNVSAKLTEFINNFSGIDTGAIESAKSLMGAMGEIGLTTVGTTLSDIFTLGGTSMEKFQTDGVAFFEAMKAISTAATGITLDEGSIDAVIGVATELSGLQGSLEPIGGVMDWFTGRDDLATFGTNIGSFILSMKIALGWLDGATFNTEALTPMIDAATQLSGLQSSLEPIGGVISWFTGRDDLGTFGVNVGAFILSMKTALGWLDGATFNTEALGSVITAATDLAGLQESLEPIGGVISWFTGRDDLGTFGDNVGAFILSMKTALSNLEGVILDQTALSSVITAATDLATLQESLEPMGGVITWFTGRSDLGTFGDNIGKFGEAMGKLREGMGEGGISQDVITSITNTGSALVELNNILPTEGWFDGKMSLSDFSTYITDFATALSDFNTKVSTINADNINTAINAAHRIKFLIDTIAQIDTSGVAKFTGIGSGGVGADGAVSDIAEAIADFGDKVGEIDTGAVSTAVTAALRLKTLISNLAELDASGVENFELTHIGNEMQSYITSVASIDESAISSSISAANRLKNFIASLVDIDNSGISKFKLTSIGDAMRDYINSVAGMDAGAVSSSISAANKLKNFIGSLAGLDTSGVGAFKSALSSLSEVSLKDITSAFSGATGELSNIGSNLIEALSSGIKGKASSVTSATTVILTAVIKNFTSKQAQFQTMGVALMTKLISGVTSKRGQVATAMSSALTMAAVSVRSKWASMYSAGTYLGSGLVQGINAKKTDAYNAGFALGQAAVQGEKDGQASNSPSKLTIQAGKWLGEGLVIGMERMGTSVYKSGKALGKTAADSMSSTVSKLATAINTDIDSQPTIRPVLDLSGVEAGAGTINGLFSTPMIGVNSNISAISTMMGRRSQNGTNADVIAAIDKLGKDISANSGNTSYNINGVTYDDGSNIKNAVETIVRAAVMERRM